MDRSFFEAPVAVPKLSGFDKSFQNLLTTKVGTITPILFDEIMPGSIINLDMALSASLPPLASETFMRCSVKVEAFFVPMRLLYGGFEHYFVGDTFEIQTDEGFIDKTIDSLPSFFILGSDNSNPTAISAPDATILNSRIGAGSLADYLGFKCNPATWSGSTVPASSYDYSRFNLLPFIAYHKVWTDWYRASLIQRDCFAPVDSSIPSSDLVYPVASLPYLSDLSSVNAFVVLPTSSPSTLLADDHDLFSARQRNFGFDYFTCATPTAQNGDASAVTIGALSAGTSGFTISQLRTMNSLQQWKERNNLLGDRYVDRLYGQYGCRPSDGIAQLSLCLGTADFEVYSKGIYQNDNGTTTNNNPFAGQVGARYGSAYASSNGSVSLCHGFKAAEPGYLLVNATLVPRVTYSMGVNPLFNRYVLDDSIGQMANPILQNIGPEPIYRRELTENIWSDDVFGYTDRYGSFKNKFDELHGLVRDGESLESFALQRYLDDNSDPAISSEFLEIPTDYMDNVTAVKQTISNYGVWLDTYFDYKVSMPLAKYSLPSLQDPAYEHGKTLVVRRGGFRF